MLKSALLLAMTAEVYAIWSRLDDLIANSVANQVAQRLKVQLMHDACTVGLYCLGGDSQDSSHLFVTLPFRLQAESLPFPVESPGHRRIHYSRQRSDLGQAQ